MGHNICAIIGHADQANLEPIKKYQLAAAFENGFAIIILFDESMYYWHNKTGLDMDSESEDINWASPLSFFLAEEIGFKQYAIIQTDYFGGIGTQCASLYEDRIAIIKDTSINEVLFALGVSPTEGTDCFDTINLGDYRNDEYYYWDEMNFAENKPNMISGRVPKE